MSSEPRRVTLPPALAALLDTGASLIGKAPSARIAIARLHGVVDPEGLPRILREDVVRAIERAHAGLPAPMSAKDVEKLLKQAWDEDPADVVDGLQREPSRVLPHLQEHAAELDGAPVTVAVSRPGVARATRNDLSLLDTLARPLGAVLPRLDASAGLSEARERVLDELDPEHAVEALAAAGRAARSADGLAVVKVHRDLSTDGVLVTGRVDRPTLAERPDPAAAPLVVRLFAGAPRATGLVLADPRADELVYHDGTLTLCGAGASRPVPTERIDAAADALQALRDGDEDAFAAVLSERLGAFEPDDARTAYALARDLVGPLLTAPAKLDAPTLADLAERALDRLGELLELAAVARPDPADLWPGRALGLTVVVLARLGATEDWGALTLDALRNGW